jgi:glycerophosphoryl diester phosphodiesterase
MYDTFRGAMLLIAMGAILSSTSFGQLIIAHRGASHDAPENTLAAFRLALEQGADGIEADFHLTADGQVICLHDRDTKRVAGADLIVAQAQAEQLLTLDVGRWKGEQWTGERMPTLEEVLAIVPKDKKIFIELKSNAEIVAPLADILADSTLLTDQIIIISFHADAIAACKKLLPQYKAYWLCNYKKQQDGSWQPTVEEVAATLKRIKADGLDTEANTEHVNQAFLRRLREMGIQEIHVWTVDDPNVAEYYSKLGARSITTNRPGWLRERMSAIGGD